MLAQASQHKTHVYMCTQRGISSEKGTYSNSERKVHY
jgi:hypothetical protein